MTDRRRSCAVIGLARSDASSWSTSSAQSAFRVISSRRNAAWPGVQNGASASAMSVAATGDRSVERQRTRFHAHKTLSERCQFAVERGFGPRLDSSGEGPDPGAEMLIQETALQQLGG